jgi:hypothetical protein
LRHLLLRSDDDEARDRPAGRLGRLARKPRRRDACNTEDESENEPFPCHDDTRPFSLSYESHPAILTTLCASRLGNGSWVLIGSMREETRERKTEGRGWGRSGRAQLKDLQDEKTKRVPPNCVRSESEPSHCQGPSPRRTSRNRATCRGWLLDAGHGVRHARPLGPAPDRRRTTHTTPTQLR